MKRLTPDVITDEQISDLQDRLVCDRAKIERQLNKVNDQIIDCELALQGYIGGARARCAKIMNARTDI